MATILCRISSPLSLLIDRSPALPSACTEAEVMQDTLYASAFYTHALSWLVRNLQPQPIFFFLFFFFAWRTGLSEDCLQLHSHNFPAQELNAHCLFPPLQCLPRTSRLCLCLPICRREATVPYLIPTAWQCLQPWNGRKQLGLYDDDSALPHVCSTSAFSIFKATKKSKFLAVCISGS